MDLLSGGIILMYKKNQQRQGTETFDMASLMEDILFFVLFSFSIEPAVSSASVSEEGGIQPLALKQHESAAR